jgi:uncharacterized protein
MGERDGYEPGTFCWVDLATTDQEGAKAFYAGLFGWQSVDMPVEEGVYYSMQRVDGKDVAAIAGQPPQQRDAGVPPMWNNYIWVESADATAERAAELGATVHAPPFDVLEAGRMAVIQDPQGAYFMAWEPRNHRGAGLVNAPGALSWNELASPDMDGSSEFYSGLFGWGLSPLENSPQPYLVIQVGERSNGGIRELAPPGTPPHWLPYFALDDVDSGLAKVEQLGGSTLVGSTDIGIAKIAVVQDPQGAYFAIYAGQLDP